MKVLEFLESNSVSLNLESPGKEEAIRELVKLLEKNKKINNSGSVIQSLMDRERLGSTGIGMAFGKPKLKLQMKDGLSRLKYQSKALTIKKTSPPGVLT